MRGRSVPGASTRPATSWGSPHGYAFEFNSLWDPPFAPGEAPNEIGRRPFGRIRIANSDAGAYAYTQSAIDQAHRAVSEILSG